MSQRNSGYKRRKNDTYETPAWVTESLLPFIPRRVKTIWEPASGSGKMVRVLRKKYSVTGTDIARGKDFLTTAPREGQRLLTHAIITNPPFKQAQAFIEHALELTAPGKGFVAMLLPADFDHAKTRHHLFGHCIPFRRRIVLTRRIRWIEGSTGSPSQNHVWLCWDWHNSAPATVAYAP